MSALRLRPMEADDEATMLAVHDELSIEGFTVLFRRDAFETWLEYLLAIRRARDERRETRGMTPCHWLLAEVDGEVVGVLWVRFGIEPARALAAGHIGYCVLPEFRRRGYATEMLARALVIARAEGVDPITLNCRADNVASRALIEGTGARLASVIDHDVDAPMHHYEVPTPARLTLRPFREADRVRASATHAATMALDDFEFLLGYEPERDWDRFVQRERDGRVASKVPLDRVLSYQLAAVVGGELVGRTSVRFELNEFLRHYGGHIGYCVVPEERHRGYATEILRQALVVWRTRSAGSVLMVCNDDNLGSRRVIEGNGGRLEAITPDEDGTAMIRRYWIEPHD